MTTVPENFPLTRVARRAIAAVLVGCLAAAPAARAQGTKGISLQPGEHGPKLAIDVNGKSLTEWTVTAIPDTVVITVTPQDSLGNPIPLVGYEIQVWDPHVMELVGSTIGASNAVSKLVPHNRGQTTIQIRGNGVRSWVLVELGPSTLGMGPRGEPVAGAGGLQHVWTAGVRGSWAHYSYDFKSQTTIKGGSGGVGEAYIGWAFPSGLEIVSGLGFGVLSADSAGTSITAHELEWYLRGDYSIGQQYKVRPVVSLGLGVYRIRTGGVTPGISNPGIWNTSFTLVGGGGVDYTVSTNKVIEFRVTSQQLFEVTSGKADGYVGNLLLIGAGVRFEF